MGRGLRETKENQKDSKRVECMPGDIAKKDLDWPLLQDSDGGGREIRTNKAEEKKNQIPGSGAPGKSPAENMGI